MRRAAEHVEVPCVYFLMTQILVQANPSTDAQGSWDAQGCCTFGCAGLLSIWIRRAAEHVEVPCGYFLMTILLQYAAPSTSLRDPGTRRAAEHLDAQGC